jgi:hypothetical protein
MNPKTQVYEYLFNINRDFQQLAESILNLREVHIFPETSVRAHVNRAEELRALINHCCLEMLDCIEHRDAFRFAQMARADEEAAPPFSEDDPPVLAGPLKLLE